MNKDQAKGELKDVGGKIRREVGDLTGNTSEQVKGAAEQAEGKVQKKVGDAKEGLRDARDDANKH